MPIRFRCVYCEQLLGIAHRKAGTVVKCPNCAGQLIVPAPDASDDPSDPDVPTMATESASARKPVPAQEQTAAAPQPQPAGGEAGMLFERSDFDELLKPALERSQPALVGKASRSSRRSLAPQPLPAPAPPPLTSFNFAAPEAPVAVAPPVASVAAQKPRPGIVLTPLKLIVLAILVITGMGFTFVGGLLLGWYLGK